ncbi:hypothetical protein DL767_003231 [Monosporascus sp. MG133]|nr:hypothetical protein DL767_003231 [Monosporascus sp. MG133]
MRLLHAKSLALHDFPNDDQIPEYAILSHTWGGNGDEVTIKDLSGWTPLYKRKPGWAKIKGCCKQAVTDGIEYVWIDTCCMDRSNRSQEAVGDEIQSIWKYYSGARVCYAHLADVQASPETTADSPDSDFWRSRWFTRGWTVPELLAPIFVRFYDVSWKYLGSKAELSRIIEGITGIGAHVLRDPGEVKRQSVACRMSWVSTRETSREEDIAYCLLGIFGVKMPIDYGEGRRNAFIRLQYHILRSSKDLSLFTWGYNLPLGGTHGNCSVGMLAETPSAFEHCGQVEPVSSSAEPSFEVTASGLQFRLPMQIDEPTGTALLNLECAIGDYYLVLPLNRSPTTRKEFERTPYGKPTLVHRSKLATFSTRPVNTQLINRSRSISAQIEVSLACPEELIFELADVYPPNALQNVGPVMIVPAEGEVRCSLYLSDLPWAMLSVQNGIGQRFLISIERETSPTESKVRTLKTLMAEVPDSRSLSSGPPSTAAFSLMHLLPIFESAPIVAWKDGMETGGLLVGSDFQMPGAGRELRTVRIVIQRDSLNRTEFPSSITAKIGKKGDKKKVEKKK